jgi:hypothetical protein
MDDDVDEIMEVQSEKIEGFQSAEVHTAAGVLVIAACDHYKALLWSFGA